ncbi:transport protein Avl9-domain-containing protein [Pisolithus croceorrhizus]|nr:transport protein Avl9-domain-containing protein [Pisolithus croceorrhizus]
MSTAGGLDAAHGYTDVDLNDEHRHEDSDADAETASQQSVQLDPTHASSLRALNTPLRAQEFFARRDSQGDSIEIDFNSEPDDVSDSKSELEAPRRDSFASQTLPSSRANEEKSNSAPITYPPTPSSSGVTDSDSFASAASSYSKKARPESMLLQPPEGPLILGIALIDFNHLVGPRIEFSQGDIFEDEEIAKMLPFLALPDGAHLSLEDYSYFHLVPSTPNPSTIFGISCNRQIATSVLLVKDVDVTRSIVQKAVVVLASKPVFGPIRDRLGVVTKALFQQRDFSDTKILVEFGNSLEMSLRTQLTESGLYIGRRALVHVFRQKTLVILKALILQKKIMFFGHPVERLCTYQYSLISLIPSLLQTLDDCGSPPLAARAPTLSRPNSLKTSDRKSMLTYMGLPLDLFGKDAFFQPYLPLQQLDLLKDSRSWLCGSTNTIVTQQKEIDLLINTETATLEFRNPSLERLVALTPADRKWMDEIVRDVNDAWDDAEPVKPALCFKGSDDYLRAKFEEYVSAALACVRYREFLVKGKRNNVIIAGTGDTNSVEDFNSVWLSEFTKTNAYEVWDRSTDPMLFDIVEPRHPCNERPSVVADLGLRLSEGIQDLKLEQQLAPTREAISRTLTASSTNFFKAVEGVRGRLQQRVVSSTSVASDLSSTSLNTSAEISKSEADMTQSPDTSTKKDVEVMSQTSRDSVASLSSGSRSVNVVQAAADTKAVLSSWGAGIHSLWTSRSSRFSMARSSVMSIASRESVASPTTPVPSTAHGVASPTSPTQQRTTVDTVPELSEHNVGQTEDHPNHDGTSEPTGLAL